MFNVSGVSSYCKKEIKDSHTVWSEGDGRIMWKKWCSVKKKKRVEFDIMHCNDICLVKWPQLF